MLSRGGPRFGPVTDSPPSAALLRGGLASRSFKSKDHCPVALRAAAADAGVLGADAFLCRLMGSVVAALELLAASADASRAYLQLVRAANDFHPHFDDLQGAIDHAESVKRTALELELCAADAALEGLRIVRGAVAEAAGSLGNAELVAQHAVLSARLDAAEAQLLALPTTSVEPPYVGLVMDASSLLPGITVFGRVIAPRAVTAADLALDVAPNIARSGDPLLLRFVLFSAFYASLSTEELEVSMGAAAAAMRVDAALKVKGAASHRLPATISVDVCNRCMIISFAIPLDAAAGALFCVGPRSVCGRPIAGISGLLSIPVVHSLHAPRRLCLPRRKEVAPLPRDMMGLITLTLHPPRRETVCLAAWTPWRARV